MAVMEDVDTESIEHLDFQTPCVVRIGEVRRFLGWKSEVVEGRCEHPATWVMRCRTCGVVGALCAEHQARIVADPRATCVACETTAAPLDVFSFTPLGGA